MSMYKVIAVSNRKLCSRSLTDQIEYIASLKKPDALILREKDLSEREYEELAKKVMEKCYLHQIDCILHSHIQTALRLNCKKIQLSVSGMKENKEQLHSFEQTGISVHSVEEAIWAEKNGASYIIAGHIFETDCKKGVSGRGLSFLKEVCDKTTIPVYAIGGINKQNVHRIKDMGANGVCVMSGFMNL